MKTAIAWFRRDLRVTDNDALAAAAAHADRVVPLFIFAPEEEAPWQPGAASGWWLHHSLAALDAQLSELGAPLIVRRGDSLGQLERLIEETGAESVFFNRLYEPAIIERDHRVRNALCERGIDVSDYNAALLFEPGEICNKAGDPYQVFTPFWRAALARLEPATPQAAPGRIAGFDGLESLTVDDLGLLPKISWDEGFYDAWSPGEAGAIAQLEAFVSDTVAGYADARDRPAGNGTSRLSPCLHFGEISPRQAVWEAHRATARSPALERGVEAFLRELGWREFAHHLLFHFPHTTDRPLRDEFGRFPWRNPEAPEDDDQYLAWCRGRTGVPLVDAGMRQLWRTGWMHNRVRMVVASFLTKNQLISWRAGARWFWDTLVDADLASNTLGWQWTAGCGADAAPFFRIFNPVLQGKKFDADETYVRRWCPELRAIPPGKGHSPWSVESGWSPPVVDLAGSRRRALDAYQQLK